MKVSFIKTLAYTCLIAGFALAGWYLVFGNFLSGYVSVPSPTKAKDISPFITAIVAPLFTLAGALLVIANLVNQTRQNFSSNFFSLIAQHHKIVDSLNTVVDDVSSADKPSVKRDFFDDICQRIKFDYDHLPVIEATAESDTQTKPESLPEVSATSANTGGEVTIKVKFSHPSESQEMIPASWINITNETGIVKLCKIYDAYYHVHQSDLSHYFRSLYHIVKYVDQQPFPWKFRYQHIKILRSQLSNYEILLLAYNGLHKFGKKFRPLINNYRLLKNLNLEINLPANREPRIIDYHDLVREYKHLEETVRLQTDEPVHIPRHSLKKRVREWVCEKLAD